VTTSAEIRDLAIRHGLEKKRNNAIVAVLSGALPGLVLGYHLWPHWRCWVAGVTIGLLWSNAFEYAYHRWLLHRPRSSFARGHLQHHMRVGAPDEPAHVSLGRHPSHIALLFASNGIAVMGLDLLIGFKLAPGIFVGWTAYLVLAEEIHWRIHMDGWLPPGLRFARAYHMSHHDFPNIRYNVFLPFCDLLFGNSALACAPRRQRPAKAGRE
jgi:Fatty acid hydroxylase superfamily